MEPLAPASGFFPHQLWALRMSYRVLLRLTVRGFGVYQGVPTTQTMAAKAIARNTYTIV